MFSFFKRKRGSSDNAKSDAPQVPVAPEERQAEATPPVLPPADAGGGARQDLPARLLDDEHPGVKTEPSQAQQASSSPPVFTEDRRAQAPDAASVTPEPVVAPLADVAALSAAPAEATPEPGVRPDAGPGVPEAAASVFQPEPVPEVASAPLPEPLTEPLQAVAAGDPVPVSPEPAPAKKSWLSRLSKGLARTGQSISSLFVGVPVDENLFEELETALIMADAGVEATEALLAELRGRVRKERLTDGQQVKLALRDILSKHLQPLEKPFPLDRAKPLVVMIAGVNGAGKTTSIGKLAYAFQQQGRSVLLAAGDTFRAAAREQLIEWGERNNVSVIAQDGGDPAAVAFDAVNAGRARQSDVVMVDTAGRLPTQLHLMEELKKIRRVIGKADGNAPHEVLLVVDGNTGQNVISQIKAFDAAINLTGLIVTKLDGTAKGGALAAVAAGSQGVRAVPVYWIGVGEGMEDLQPFVAAEFAAAIIAD